MFQKYILNAKVLNIHCECRSGNGLHGTCKHIAAVLYMFQWFIFGNHPTVCQICTEIHQIYYKPKKHYGGTHLKAKM
jgi:hypothetical protein